MQEGIKAATDELREKSISLAESHYGSLPYILAYAASGFKCNIHLINTVGEVRVSDLQCVRARLCNLSVKLIKVLALPLVLQSLMALPIMYFWMFQNIVFVLLQWARHVGNSKPILVAALQQSALRMFACCVGVQPWSTL